MLPCNVLCDRRQHRAGTLYKDRKGINRPSLKVTDGKADYKGSAAFQEDLGHQIQWGWFQAGDGVEQREQRA